MNLIHCHNPIAAPWELGLLCSFSVHIRYIHRHFFCHRSCLPEQNQNHSCSDAFTYCRRTPTSSDLLPLAAHLSDSHPIFIMFKISIHRSLR